MEPFSQFSQTPAVAIFLGTLPLLGAVIWNLLGNNRQFDQMNKRLDLIDGRLDRIERRLDRLEDRLVKIESSMGDIRERLAKLETRFEGNSLMR